MAEGFITNTANLKKQLLDLNRNYYGRQTWRDAILASNFSTDQQLQNLDVGYNDAVAKAYQSAQANKQQIENSNLGIGYKSALLEENDAALQEAYNTYYNNYLQSKQNVIDYNAKNLQAIDEKLTYQADMTGRYIDSRFGYLQDLFDNTPELFNDPLFSRWTNEAVDENGNVMTDENGNTIRELKTKDELLNAAYDMVGGQKEYTSLLDEDGNLTIRGTEFFDQIDNMIANGYTFKDSNGKEVSPKSFGAYLSETDKEVYDWAMDQDLYNYTQAGTNRGTVNTLLGLKSTDEQYSFIERFGGLTSKEVDTMFTDFKNAMSEVGSKVDKSTGRDSKDLIKEYNTYTDQIKKMAHDLGITEEIENELYKEIGIKSIDDLAGYMKDMENTAKSNSDIWWEGMADLVKTEGEGASIGSAAGGIIGALAAGPAGATAGSAGGAVGGALIGSIVGVYVGIKNSEEDKSGNRKLAQSTKQLYNNLLMSMIAYSKQSQQNAQQSYKNRYS